MEYFISYTVDAASCGEAFGTIEIFQLNKLCLSFATKTLECKAGLKFVVDHFNFYTLLCIP